MALSIILTLLPIALIVVLMTWRRLAADISGTAGWILALVCFSDLTGTPLIESAHP